MQNHKIMVKVMVPKTCSSRGSSEVLTMSTGIIAGTKESNNNPSWQYCQQIILENIFAKLEPIDRVNAATLCEWYENTAQRRSIWKELDLRGAIFPESILDRLLSFPIGKLNLSGCILIKEPLEEPSTFPPDSEVTEPDFSFMETLVLQWMWGFDEMKAGILGKCRPVELFLDYGSVTIQMLKAVGKNSRLKVLSLKESTFHFPDSEEYFISSSLKDMRDQIAGITVPKSIEKLMLNHAGTLHLPSISDDLTKAFHAHYLRNTTNLRNLGMSMKLLTPKIMEIVGNLELLETLWFCTCEWESISFKLARILPGILKELPRIKFLHIFKDHKITCDHVVEELFKSYRNEVSDLKTGLARNGIEMTVQCTENGYKLLLCRS